MITQIIAKRQSPVLMESRSFWKREGNGSVRFFAGWSPNRQLIASRRRWESNPLDAALQAAATPCGFSVENHPSKSQIERSQAVGRADRCVGEGFLHECRRSFRRLAGWRCSPRKPGSRCGEAPLPRRPSGKVAESPPWQSPVVWRRFEPNSRVPPRRFSHPVDECRSFRAADHAGRQSKSPILHGGPRRSVCRPPTLKHPVSHTPRDTTSTSAPIPASIPRRLRRPHQHRPADSGEFGDQRSSPGYLP